MYGQLYRGFESRPVRGRFAARSPSFALPDLGPLVSLRRSEVLLQVLRDEVRSGLDQVRSIVEVGLICPIQPPQRLLDG